MAADDSGLTVTGLVRHHPDFTLGPLSFALTRGRVLGLLGANGAGKTTLLSAIAGQSRLQGGEITWNGERVVRGMWSYREHVSLVRDVPVFYGDLTVSQTLAFVARLYPTWNRARAAALLELFDLSSSKHVKALSRGMKAKLGLLLASSHDVELLLLDEVTAGVDPDTRHEIQAYLRRLAQEHRVSIVVSSHLFEDSERVSDEVMILSRGAVAFSGALGTLPPGGLRDLYFATKERQ